MRKTLLIILFICILIAGITYRDVPILYSAAFETRQIKHPMPISFIDEDGNTYGVKHTDNEIHVLIRTRDADKTETLTNFNNLQQLFEQILITLKKIELHQSVLSDMEIKEQDLGD